MDLVRPGGGAVGRGLLPRRVLGARPELERLEHRFLVLELVLEHEPEDEALPEQWVRHFQVDVVEQVVRALADVLRVGARRGGPEARQLLPVVSLLAERVVDLVVRVGNRRLAVQVPEDPDLLELRDVREIPDERRLQRRDALDERLVGEGLQELVGAGAGALEHGSDLDSRVHHRTLPDRTRLVHAPSVAFPAQSAKA